jgi:hypothetical protein
MDTQRKATALRLREQDIQAILTIRQDYGITSDNQALVLAINLLARQIEEGRAPSSQAPNKQRRIPPPGFSQGEECGGFGE